MSGNVLFFFLSCGTCHCNGLSVFHLADLQCGLHSYSYQSLEDVLESSTEWYIPIFGLKDCADFQCHNLLLMVLSGASIPLHPHGPEIPSLSVSAFMAALKPFLGSS